MMKPDLVTKGSRRKKTESTEATLGDVVVGVELVYFDESVSLPAVMQDYSVLSPTTESRKVAVRQSAEEAEAVLILSRIDRELTVEEALTRQLMIRHGL